MERQHISELIRLNDRMQKNGFSFQHQDYLLLRDLLPEIVRSVKELEEEDNKSGCVCIIDDNDKVISACGAHKAWMEEQCQS